MKKITIIFFVLILIIFGVGAIFVFRPQNSTTKETITKQRKQKDIKTIEKMPTSYEKKASKKGSLEEVSYKIHLTDGSGKTVQKKAMIYLPYGYDKKQKYQTFYLMHGYGGSYQTFLGSTLFPRAFKNVLDHMIEEGDIKPTIVVTPGYTDEYGEYYGTVEGMGDELVNELIPYIESKYKTYAKETNKKGLIASRKYRGVGGFSMGGCATWYTLKNHIEYFQYYLPMSMPLYYDPSGYVASQSENSAEEIYNGMRRNNLKKYPFYIFAASGDKDFMSKATKKQLEDLCKQKEFKMTKDNFTNGNVMFHSWKGHKHSFKASYPYLYNGLIRFFRS